MAAFPWLGLSTEATDMIEERAAWLAVEHIAALYASVAAPFWRIGDGFGGSVRDVLERAFDDSGLPRPPRGVPTTPTRRRLSEAEVLQVAARAGAACTACGSTDALVLDHVVARARGGSDDPPNRQVLCSRCNGSKGAR